MHKQSLLLTNLEENTFTVFYVMQKEKEVFFSCLKSRVFLSYVKWVSSVISEIKTNVV